MPFPTSYLQLALAHARNSRVKNEHERRELKKSARMDNFWHKKDRKFNKNVSVRDFLQLFTTFEQKGALNKIQVQVIT